jgi:phosphoribosyl 1,2-cyclic phosphodiesterase
VQLTFLGTRGNIEAATRRHRRHSAALVASRGARIMIDCGEDWLGRLPALRPQAILVTHAHPDHAGGLRHGAPCPIFATADTWAALGETVTDRRLIRPRSLIRIRGISVEAFPVEHSLRAPAVGYRVSASGRAIFYVPDLVFIRDRHEALAGVRLYVGDGASLTRPLIRRRGPALIGHASVATQLVWCEREAVPAAVFTHCGTEIVSADGRCIAARIRAMGRDHGVQARVAHDGLRLQL